MGYNRCMLLKIIDRKPEKNGCFSLIFQKPAGFFFYGGQYLDVGLGDDTRAFTISSSSTEDFLMITTKVGISDFKKHLASLKTGDTLTTSHPAGTFILDETEPAVFIAGGIGITPFRSMIKYAVDQKLNTPITFFYSNSDDNFLFKKELEKWKQHLPSLTVIYYNSSQNGRLNKPKLATAVGKTVNTIFYLAGAHSFVNDMEKILKQLGIDETNIRYDRFDGYN